MIRKKEGSKKKHDKMKNRKGLSTIVVTLILVLIGLVAIWLLWNPVKKFIEGQTQITQIQSQFFSEQLNILTVSSDDPFVNITLRKPGGEIKASMINITSVQQQGLEVDIFSIVDLSGSMRQCLGITRTQCSNLGGSWSAPTCDSLLFSAQAGCLSYGGIWNDKLTATQDANRDMINNILASGNSRMGLVGYRDTVISSASTNLTNDIVLLNTVMDSWQATSMTCICCGINDAALKFNQQSSPQRLKSMIVMSDGQANTRCSQQGTGDARQDAIKAACDANASLSNFIIYSVGVQGADEATLTSIAVCGGGKYFPVANTSDLLGIYQAITKQIEETYQSITAFTYLYIIFFNGTDTYKDKIFDIPNVLETRTYNFNLQGLLSGKITRIEVYPVVVTPSTKEEVIGPLLDFWQAS